MSLVGKKYIPNDNSYSYCLNNLNKTYYLAGHDYMRVKDNFYSKSAETVTIISEPFSSLINNDFSKDKEVSMVLVEDNEGQKHCVLFYESCVQHI